MVTVRDASVRRPGRRSTPLCKIVYETRTVQVSGAVGRKSARQVGDVRLPAARELTRT